MFDHTEAQKLAVDLVEGTTTPHSLSQRNNAQLDLLDILLEQTDVDRVDGLVIIARVYAAKHPH